MLSHLTTELGTIGRYRILQRLGRGGMGEVFLAEDPTLRRRVAIKVLAEEFAADTSMRRRFINEAVAASALTHPNVAIVYEAVSTDEGRAYISMEYVEGLTLQSLLAQGPLPIARAVAIARQIADALDEAHRRGIVHRDIKPANVMVDDQGRVKVLDFGIAKIADHAEAGTDGVTDAQTGAGVIHGTALYMSPEQAAGQRVDNRSDLFSLGVVMYEMLTGKNPFIAPTMLEVFARVREVPAAPPSSVRTDCPHELDAIVMRCLEKDRNLRYQSARDVVLDLERMHDQPATPRRPSLFAASIAVAAAIVLGTAWWFAHRSPASHVLASTPAANRSIAVLPFVNMSADAGNAFIADGMSEEIINALAQVKSLQVVSRTSSFAFKGQNTDIRSIGQRLGVSSVVEGSVQRAGDRLRVTAQLVNVETGYHLWSDRYDRKIDDLFAVQDEIARAVASALRAHLRAPNTAEPPTNDLVAYEAYIKARQFSSFWTRSNFDQALVLYREAIRRDPHFAEPHAGLAELYSLMDHRAGLTSLPIPETYRLSIEESQKALAIDPDSAEAYGALGHLDVHAGKYAEADEYLRRSLEINPNDAMSHAWLGILRRVQRHDADAISELLTAVRLDPLNSQIRLVAASTLWTVGQLQLSADVAQRGVQNDPSYGDLYMILARDEMMMGHLEAARRILDDATHAAIPPASIEEHRALLLAVEGKKDLALAELRRIEREKKSPNPDGMIRGYAAAGDVDDAVRWAERLVSERINYARVGAVDSPPLPAFAALRRDPRYVQLRRRVGLPD